MLSRLLIYYKNEQCRLENDSTVIFPINLNSLCREISSRCKWKMNFVLESISLRLSWILFQREKNRYELNQRKACWKRKSTETQAQKPLSTCTRSMQTWLITETQTHVQVEICAVQYLFRLNKVDRSESSWLHYLSLEKKNSQTQRKGEGLAVKPRTCDKDEKREKRCKI